MLDPGIKLIKLEGLNLFETFSFRDRVLKLWNKKNKDYLDYYDFFKTLIGGFPEMYSFGERAKKYLSQKKDYDIIIIHWTANDDNFKKYYKGDSQLMKPVFETLIRTALSLPKNPAVILFEGFGLRYRDAEPVAEEMHHEIAR